MWVLSVLASQGMCATCSQQNTVYIPQKERQKGCVERFGGEHLALWLRCLHLVLDCLGLIPASGS